MAIDTCPDFDIIGVREALGMSQGAFAEALGVSIRTVSRWDTGRAKPTKATRRQINDLVQSRAGRKPVTGLRETTLDYSEAQ